MPGQFLLKDVVLLGVSLLTAGEALAAPQVGALHDKQRLLDVALQQQHRALSDLDP